MSKAWLIGVVVVVVTLVVAGVVVAIVTTRGEGDLLPADSPEGTVQRYLLALEDGKYREAYGYLSARTKASCDLDEFIRQARYIEVRDSHMTLEDSQRFDGTAVVVARVTVFDPSLPFGSSEYSYDRTFDLTLEGETWLLDWRDHPCPPFG